jgi:hypothetical protein
LKGNGLRFEGEAVTEQLTMVGGYDLQCPPIELELGKGVLERGEAFVGMSDPGIVAATYFVPCSELTAPELFEQPSGCSRPSMGGVGAIGSNIPTRCETGAVVGFCYHGIPITYNMTGIRSFCASTAGTIYEQLNDGTQIVCNNGRVDPAGGAYPIS